MLLAPNWFVEEYRSNVKHIFQSKGFKLKSTVTPEGSITGKTVKWPYFGTIDLQEKTRNSETPPSNPDQGMLSADLKDYDALYEIHEQDLTKMTAGEKAAAHEAGGKGVGRKSDSIIMNAANDACIAAGDKTMGNGAGHWDLIEAQYAIDALQDEDEVDEDSEITAVMPSRWFRRMMMWKEFSNAEWIGAAGLTFPAGTIGKRWNGVTWLVMSRKQLLIPAANQAYGFIYARQSLGYATNYEGKVTPAWDNRKGCWTFRFDLQAVAMALYPGAKGIRRLHYATNSPIERPVERTQTVA